MSVLRTTIARAIAEAMYGRAPKFGPSDAELRAADAVLALVEQRLASERAAARAGALADAQAAIKALPRHDCNDKTGAFGHWVNVHEALAVVRRLAEEAP